MKILFVCLGNICRSPTAQGVMQKKLADSGVDWVEVDSAGTGTYHVGSPPDPRSQKTALEHGYDLAGMHARQVSTADFYNFDYMFALDLNNLKDLKAIRPSDATAKLTLALGYSRIGDEVPDPYYGTEEDFKTVLSICEILCDDIIAALIAP